MIFVKMKKGFSEKWKLLLNIADLNTWKNKTKNNKLFSNKMDIISSSSLHEIYIVKWTLGVSLDWTDIQDRIKHYTFIVNWAHNL